MTAPASPNATARARACSSANLIAAFNRRRFLTFAFAFGVACVAYQVAWTYWLPGVLVKDYEELPDGRIATRRHPDQTKKVFNGEEIPNTPLDGVFEGHLTLIDVEFPDGGLTSSDTQEYHGITAVFCHISWNQQRKRPYHNFLQLQEASFLCPGTTTKTDLYDVAQKAHAYDAHNHTFAASRPTHGVQGQVEPTLAIFSQSKSGASVLANALMGLYPGHTRVYSDAPVTSKALRQCDLGFCESDQVHTKFLQDVFYLLGRTVQKSWPSYVFYKFDFRSDMERFQRAFPQVPWIYVYRNPIEILMSQFEVYQHQQVSRANYRPPCMPDSYDTTVFTREDACAQRLGELAETAINLAKTTPAKHWFLDHTDIPYRLWETVLPEVIVGVIAPTQLKRMHEFAKVDVRHDSTEMEHYKDDNTMKHSRAPISIKHAADTFMESSYENMKSLNGHQ